jgi:hypothetical protein
LELLPVLPYDRRCPLQSDANAAAVIDIGALGGNSSDNILGSQYRRHFVATLARMLASNAIVGVKRFLDRKRPVFPRVIPEIDIWRAAKLMLKR